MIHYILFSLIFFTTTSIYTNQTVIKATYEAKTPAEFCKKLVELDEKPNGKELQRKFMAYLYAREVLLLYMNTNSPYSSIEEENIKYNKHKKDILSYNEGKDLVENLEKIVGKSLNDKEIRKQREILEEIAKCFSRQKVTL